MAKEFKRSGSKDFKGKKSFGAKKGKNDNDDKKSFFEKKEGDSKPRSNFKRDDGDEKPSFSKSFGKCSFLLQRVVEKGSPFTNFFAWVYTSICL